MAQILYIIVEFSSLFQIIQYETGTILFGLIFTPTIILLATLTAYLQNTYHFINIVRFEQHFNSIWYIHARIRINTNIKCQDVLFTLLWSRDAAWRDESGSKLTQQIGLLPGGTKSIPEAMLTL